MARKPGTSYTTASLETWRESYNSSSSPSYTQSKTYSMVNAVSDSLVSFYSSNGDFKSPNPHSFERVRHRHTNGVTVQTSKTSSGYNRVTYTGQISSGTAKVVGFKEALRTTAYNEALNRFYDQMRGSLDLSVSIAEAGQVAGMLRATARTVSYVRRYPVKALQEFYKDFLRSPKKLGGKWLEFQYGWRPLAQDVYDCASKVIDDTPQKATIRARAHASEKWTITESPGNNAKLITTVTSKARAQVFGQFSIKPSVLNTLSQYTSLNPASVAWELTPYSFVVDWFYDIGGYIRNLESALVANTIFVGGYATIGQLQEVDGARTQNYVTSSYEEFQNLKYGSHMTYLSRTVLSAPPLPRPPQFQADLGSGRLLNAAALLSQFLGSGKR